MDIASARERLRDIEQALDRHQYRLGDWQRLVSDLETLEGESKRDLSEDVSHVSRKLHRRNGHPEVHFALALAVEGVTLLIAMLLINAGPVMLVIGGVGALALCLQPLIKVLAGLILGVRYDYAYLWYFEPRFKMRFGTYLALPGVKRVVLHLAGSLGTPVAMLVGHYALVGTNHLLGYACLVFFGAATLLQVGAFAAEWFGVRTVGAFRLSTLTSPATAAFELKRLLSESAP